MATPMTVRCYLYGKALQAYLAATYGHFFSQLLRDGFTFSARCCTSPPTSPLPLRRSSLLLVAGIYGRSCWPLNAEFLAVLFGHCMPHVPNYSWPYYSATAAARAATSSSWEAASWFIVALVVFVVSSDFLGHFTLLFFGYYTLGLHICLRTIES